MKTVKNIILIAVLSITLTWLVCGVIYIFGNFAEVNLIIVGSIISLLIIISSFLVIKYLVKPINKVTDEMKALLLGEPYKKIFTSRVDEIGVMANFFNEITASLERATAEIKERRRLSKELNTAAQIQEDLLPKEPPKIPGLDIIAKTRPAAEIGGDSYDFISNDKRSIIYLGDVTGHGIPSGLVMMMVNTMIHSFSSLELNLDQILIRTNKELKPRIKKAMFMTMVMLEWNHQKQELSFSGAGHEYLLIFRANSGEVEKTPSGGIALGMLPDNSNLTKINRLQLNKNDILVLYSDGLTEGRNSSGELFGDERLINAIKKAPDKSSAQAVHNYIAQNFSDFSETKEQLDDITLMVIRKD